MKTQGYYECGPVPGSEPGSYETSITVPVAQASEAAGESASIWLIDSDEYAQADGTFVAPTSYIVKIDAPDDGHVAATQNGGRWLGATFDDARDTIRSAAWMGGPSRANRLTDQG
jgi:hypothetical protein